MLNSNKLSPKGSCMKATMNIADVGWPLDAEGS